MECAQPVFERLLKKASDAAELREKKKRGKVQKKESGSAVKS